MKDKNPAAMALGRLGGIARGKSMTAEELAEAGRRAVKKRWADDRRMKRSRRKMAAHLKGK